MGQDARHRFVKRLVLRKALRQPAPQSNQRAENATAVGVAFAFQDAQDVLARKQPTERQAAVSGKLISNGREISSCHTHDCTDKYTYSQGYCKKIFCPYNAAMGKRQGRPKKHPAKVLS